MFVSRENGRHAPVAQLDRASAYEAEGREFEPLRARHFSHTQSSAAYAEMRNSGSPSLPV